MTDLKPFGSTTTCPKCNGTDIVRDYSAIEDTYTNKRIDEYIRARCLDCGWHTKEYCADVKFADGNTEERPK